MMEPADRWTCKPWIFLCDCGNFSCGSSLHGLLNYVPSGIPVYIIDPQPIPKCLRSKGEAIRYYLEKASVGLAC